MDKEFVSYEQALALKELGFDEPCLSYYNNKSKLTFNANNNPVSKDWLWVGNECLPIDMILSPLKQQIFEWFREKYGLYHIIHCPIKDVSVFTITGFDIPSVHSDVELKSYKEAENACIDKLIELAKQQDK
jgi:hypothetical protein